MIMQLCIIMKEPPMFANNLWMGNFLHPDTSCQLLYVPSFQQCDEQQFQTLSCALYTIFSVAKLDLVIQALLLDYILAMGKNTRTPRVHLIII